MLRNVYKLFSYLAILQRQMFLFIYEELITTREEIHNGLCNFHSTKIDVD